MQKKALITGVTGQDGSYLAELLLEKEYEVHGTIRRVSTDGRFARIEGILDKLHLHKTELTVLSAVEDVLSQVRPDEIYHLAAQTHVGDSFENDYGTIYFNVFSILSILKAMRKYAPESKFYFAGTSEMFGNSPSPQNEESRFNPLSPYASSKVMGYNLVRQYRNAYGLFACSGILFNHESPRRGIDFVTRKITLTAAKIYYGMSDHLALGNINAKRDWGFAKDYVRAMWYMLQQDNPDDYVIGTGERHTVLEFVEKTFRYAGLEWQKYLKQDKKEFRPLEVEDLQADPTKARKVLGWKPTVSFDQLVEMMVGEDLKNTRNSFDALR